MDQELCRSCPRRGTCLEPCERLLAELDSPDRGRLGRNIRARNSAEIAELLDLCPQLDPRTDAVVQLYYRCGLAMERIGQALGVNRSSVSRRVHSAWYQLTKRRNKSAL